MSVRAPLEDWGEKYAIPQRPEDLQAEEDLESCDTCRQGISGYMKEFANDDFRLLQIGTKLNTADLCKKPVNRETCEQHMRTLNQELREGKTKGAKALESTKV